MNRLMYHRKWLNRAIIIAAISLGQLALFPDHTFAASSEQQQVSETITVSGIIKDQLGPLVGVSVAEMGTTNGTITDMDGKYSIKVPSNANIEISYIGYVKQSIPVAGKRTINISMTETTQNIGEVIVTGYSTQKKESVTGAISGIRSEDISVSAATTASGAIVGKIAGVNSRMSNGQPGRGTSLNIRNMGTPLYIIDGIQSSEDQFNNLDFNNIEQLNVLKDASAAIYGVKAANGVVVITTKDGKLGEKNTINVNGYYGIQSLFRFARPADAPTYVKNYMQSQTIKGDTPQYTMEDLAKWQAGTEPGYRGFDWYKEIFTTAPQKYISANTSGGSENLRYYVAISNLNQQSLIRNYGGFERTNAQISVDANVSNRLKIGASFKGYITDEKHPGVPGADDLQEAFISSYKNRPTERPYANDNPNYPAHTNGNNFALMNYALSGTSSTNQNDILFNIHSEFEIINGLKIKGQAGYHLYNSWYDNQEFTYKEYGYDESNDTYPVVVENNNPWRERRVKKVQDFTSQIQLLYNKKIDEHNITALLGGENYKKITPEFWMHALPPSNVIQLIDYASMDEFNDDGKRTEARLGYMAKVNYDYAGKYLFEFSSRYDGSWKFPENDRWGFFPSASIGWRISEENFWKESSVGKVMDNLKIRASYGMLGDDNVPNYSAFDFVPGYNYKVGGAALDGEWIIGAQNRGLPVTTLTWIKSKIFDIGVDYSFFDGKLNGGLDYFKRTRTGLPARRYDVLVPAETGFEIPYENLNTDYNKGVDASINWSSKVGKVNYTVGGNITYSRRYDGMQYKPRFGNSIDEYRHNITDRFGNLSWGYHSIGQFQSWEEIAQYKIDNDGQGNRTMRPGDIKYQDVNGDGFINNLDERPIGYQQGALPYLNFGLNFSADYRNFDLSLGFAGASFMTHQQNWESKIPFINGGNNPQYYFDDSWHLTDPSDANSALIPGKYPIPIIGGNDSNNRYSDFWLNNVTYMKLKNLEFGYTLPKNTLQRLNIQKVRVYILCQNLFSIDNVNTGLDPELDEQSGMQYPTSRVVNVGFNLTF